MGKHDKRFQRRKKRVRGKISGTKAVPRLSVYRSNKAIYAQIIDDEKGETLASATSLKIKKSKLDKTKAAELVGEEIAKEAKKKKISKVVFDRSGYKYHGRVKTLSEGARKGGLKF